MSRQPKGWISRYAWGDDYHALHETQAGVPARHHSTRFFWEPVEGKAFVDSGPMLEREFAGTAGIGWIGKNTHLISPKKGSWFFLGELFSTCRLPTIDQFVIAAVNAICV